MHTFSNVLKLLFNWSVNFLLIYWVQVPYNGIYKKASKAIK